MPEQQGYVLVSVAELLARQLDIETHCGGAPEVGPAVGGFHDSGAAARNHGESGVGKQPRRLLGKRIVRMAGRNARAAEHAHCRTDLVHSLGGLDEFLHNAEQTPGLARRVRLPRGGVERFRNLVAHKFPWKKRCCWLTGRRTCTAPSMRCPTCATLRASPPARSTACSTCYDASLPTTRRTILHASSTRGARLSATRCTRNTRLTDRPCPTISARRSSRSSTPSGPRAGLCCRSKEWRRTTSSARSRARPKNAACAA